MPPGDSPDWTGSAPKWAAVIVLGAVSLAGMAWSIFVRQPRPVYSPAVVYREAPPPVSAPPSMPAMPVQAAPPSERSSGSAPEAVLSPMPVQPDAPRLELLPAPDPKLPANPPADITRLININTATAAELELLPGVGPALAGRIIEHRRLRGPFKSIDELDHVSGIGPRTLEKIRPHATIK